MINILTIFNQRELSDRVVRIMSREPDLRVYACTDAGEAVGAVSYRRPDIAVADAHCAGFDGLFDTLRDHNIPVIVTSYLSRIRSSCLMNGAVSFYHQPPAEDDAQLADFGALLTEDIRRRFTKHDLSDLTAVSPYTMNGTDIIAIGASTGGTTAIESILTDLPRILPPLIITQHMPDGFTGLFSKRLNGCTQLDVIEAEDNMRLEMGMCVIARGGRNMELFRDNKGYFIRSVEGVRNGGLCPTVDVMFETASWAAKDRVLAFLLTGMGADGARGMLALRRAGSYTVCQDKESSAVYGMPMEAKAMGACCTEMSLDRIPGFIRSRLGIF